MAEGLSADLDLVWVERFGAVFEWNALRAQEMTRDFNLAVRRKQIIPFKLQVSRFYRLFYLATVVGAMMSILILLTLFQQSYLESSSNMLAGFVLGATAVGCIIWIHTLLSVRRARTADPYWSYTMIRVGVDRDTLWIYKHHTISVFASRVAFVDVKQFGNFISAYVSPQTAHFFPVDVLRGTENGRSVLAWFETHWPKDDERDNLGQFAPRRGFPRRLVSWIVRSIYLIILALIAIVAFLYIGSHLQDLYDKAIHASGDRS